MTQLDSTTYLGYGLETTTCVQNMY